MLSFDTPECPASHVTPAERIGKDMNAHKTIRVSWRSVLYFKSVENLEDHLAEIYNKTMSVILRSIFDLWFGKRLC